MARSTRPTRPARLALTLAVAGLSVAGCSPIATLDVYSPSDGVAAVLGEEIRADNLLIITSGEDRPGVLLAGLKNLSDTESEVTLTVGSESFTLPLDARGSLLLQGATAGSPDIPGDSESPDGPNESPGAVATTSPIPGHRVEHVLISSVPAPPGAVTEVTISTPSAGEVTVPVPVLDGTLAPYDDVLPGGSSDDAGAGEGTADEGSRGGESPDPGSPAEDGSPTEGSAAEDAGTSEGAGH